MTVDIKKVVSGFQWSVSGVVVIAVMVAVTGLSVWDWLSTLATWYVVTVGPVSMVVGMWIVWQFKDWRRAIVVAVELLILFCGVGMFHAQVDRAKADEGNATRKAFLEGAEYRTALDKYKTAKKSWDAQVERIGIVPGNYTTGALLTTEAGTKAQSDFEEASKALIEIEAKAPKAPEATSGAGVFRIFGKSNEDMVLAIIMFLVGLAYEATALALSWTPMGQTSGAKEKPDKGKQRTKSDELESQKATMGPSQVKEYTAQDYLNAARSGRSDGYVWGRAKVMEILGIPEREARRLYAECIEKGWIRTGTSPKVVENKP